jgi:hypothetical protein
MLGQTAARTQRFKRALSIFYLKPQGNSHKTNKPADNG